MSPIQAFQEYTESEKFQRRRLRYAIAKLITIVSNQTSTKIDEVEVRYFPHHTKLVASTRFVQ